MKYFIRTTALLFASLAIFFVFAGVGNVAWAALVNINTADITELDTLPGIGPAKAQAIIDYRETNGLFSKIEDIMNVSGIGEATFNNMKDFITVGDVTDDGGDDDDDDDTSTTTATSTDSTATSTATSTSTTTTSSKVISTHYYQEAISTYTEPTNVFEVSAGRDRSVFVGSPMYVEAKYKVSIDLANQSRKFTWSFGDGATSVLEKPEHVYQYPGEYHVVLNVTVGEKKSVARMKVLVSAPDLSLSVHADGALIVTNQALGEVNLYGLKLSAEAQTYLFPLDTIIGAQQSVIFPVEYTHITGTNQAVSLTNMAEQILADTSLNLNSLAVTNAEPVVTVAEFERFVLAYNKLTPGTALATAPPKQVPQVPPEPESQPATLTNSPVNPPSASVMNTDVAVSDVPLTATVMDAPSFGFWSKLFHPVRTIREAFYQ